MLSEAMVYRGGSFLIRRRGRKMEERKKNRLEERIRRGRKV
jgi:hypothetical protein